MGFGTPDDAEGWERVQRGASAGSDLWIMLNRGVEAPEGVAELGHNAGDELLITTATNRFIVEPIAAHFGVRHLLATEPERDGDRFTGRILRANFRDAKVGNLKAWLDAHPVKFERLSGYSDSHNDLPLLEFVHHPHAVDADPILRATAEARGWPVISLRD